MSGSAIATVGTPAGLKGLLASNADKIGEVVSSALTPERLTRTALLAAYQNPKLYECTPGSLVSACMDAAAVGLDVGGSGQGYLVPYRNGKLSKSAGRDVREAKFVPGYRGLIEVALRSPAVSLIDAQVVRTGDEFGVELGTSSRIIHRPSAEPGEVIAAYAVAWIKGAPTPVIEVMWKWQIDEIRDQSLRSKYDKEASPWTTNYDEMGRKCPIRRICKRLPSNPDLDRALEIDNSSEPIIVRARPVSISAAQILGEAEEPEPQAALLTDRQKVTIRGYATKVGLKESDADAAAAMVADGLDLDSCPAEHQEAILGELKNMSEVAE